ncbi:hypothetical protein DV738_g2395, partial [Chaetothyriales sp. CBS 135597]
MEPLLTRPVKGGGQDPKEAKATARKLKKRELDRKAQRLARERTKNRIQELESMVELLKADAFNPHLSSLMATLNKVKQQRDELQLLVRSIDQTIQRHIREQASNPAPPSEGQKDLDGVTPGGGGIDDDETDASMVVRSQYGQPPADEDGNAPAGASATRSQTMDRAWGMLPGPTPRPSGLSQSRCIPSPAAEPVEPTSSSWGQSIQFLPEEQIETSIPSDDIILPPPEWPCHCLETGESNIWREANLVLGKSTALSPAQLAIEDFTSEDTPVRVVLDGWDSVIKTGKMSASWWKLRRIDELCFSSCGDIERPGLRERFIFSQHRYCTNLFWQLFRSSIRLSLAFNLADCYNVDPDTGRYVLSPAFDLCLRDINVWRMTHDFFIQFPELSEDIPVSGSIPPSVGYTDQDMAIRKLRAAAAASAVARHPSSPRQSHSGMVRSMSNASSEAACLSAEDRVHAQKKDLDDAAYNALIVAEIGRLRAQINDQAVCELASSLNDGKPCIVEYPSKAVGQGGALMGCANYHARIRFGDGSPSSWLMRVPRVSGFAVGLPVSLAEYLIRSEYATLKFLESTAVPAPRAFSFGIPSEGTDHGIGVCFLLMEELPGKPWDGRQGGDDATKIWKGLAEIYVELEKHPFTKAGFVCLYPYGPFETSLAYYTAWAEQYLALIADGQLYPQFPIEAYLVYRFLQDNATQLSSDSDSESEQFFLKHVDDKGDHLMVDENLNITGIIDWQMARVVPRREAFALSLVSADMRALCEGNVSLSTQDVALRNALREKEEGVGRLASHMGDEKVRRFFWGLGLEPEWAYALPLANAILQVFGVEQGWGEWRELALKRYEGDERLKALLVQGSFRE